MDQYEKAIEYLSGFVNDYKAEKESQRESEVEEKISGEIPVGISNRHIHLSKRDLNTLFGYGYELNKFKDLSQPGQFAAKETVTICGPKGAIEKVRILGPTRNQTQVEILAGDTFKLGIKTEPRMSGELKNTPGVTIIGKCGAVTTREGLIIAERHIHMSLEDAKEFGVKDGDNVKIETEGLRSGILNNVTVRANDNSSLECHLDMEEANAMGLNSKSIIKIIK